MSLGAFFAPYCVLVGTVSLPGCCIDDEEWS